MMCTSWNQTKNFNAQVFGGWNKNLSVQNSKILSVPSWNSEKKVALAFDMSMLWDRACDKGNMEL